MSLASENVSKLLEQDPTPEFETLSQGGVRDIEQLALPYLRGVSQIRDELRRIVSAQNPDTKKAILELHALACIHP